MLWVVEYSCQPTICQLSQIAYPATQGIGAALRLSNTDAITLNDKTLDPQNVRLAIPANDIQLKVPPTVTLTIKLSVLC